MTTGSLDDKTNIVATDISHLNKTTDMVRDDSHEKSQWTNNFVIRELSKSERQKTQVLPTFKVYEQLY